MKDESVDSGLCSGQLLHLPSCLLVRPGHLVVIVIIVVIFIFIFIFTAIAITITIVMMIEIKHNYLLTSILRA